MRNHNRNIYPDRNLCDHPPQNSKRLSFTSILSSRQLTATQQQPEINNSRLSSYSPIHEQVFQYPTLAEMMHQFQDYPDEEYILSFADDQYQDDDEQNQYYQQSFEYGQNPLQKWIASQSHIKSKKSLKENIPQNIRKTHKKRQNQPQPPNKYKLKLNAQNPNQPKLNQLSQQFYKSKNYPHKIQNTQKRQIHQPSHNTSQIISSIASDDFKNSLKMGQSSLYRYNAVDQYEGKQTYQKFNLMKNKNGVRLNNYFGNAKIIQSQAYQPEGQPTQLKVPTNNKIMINRKNGNIGISQQVNKVSRDLQTKQLQNKEYNKQNQIRQVSQKQYTQKYRDQEQMNNYNKKQSNKQQNEGVGYSFASNMIAHSNLRESQKSMDDDKIVTKQDKKNRQEQQKLDKLAFIAITKSQQDEIHINNIQQNHQSYSKEYSDYQQSYNQDSNLMANDDDLMPINSQLKNSQKQIHICLSPQIQFLKQNSRQPEYKQQYPQLKQDNKQVQAYYADLTDSETSNMITLPKQLQCHHNNIQPQYQKEHNDAQIQYKNNTVNYQDYFINSDNSRSYDVNYTNIDSNFDDSKANSSENMIPQIVSNCKYQRQSIVKLTQYEHKSEKSSSVKQDQQIPKIFVGIIQQQKQEKPQSININPKQQNNNQYQQSFKGQIKVQQMSNLSQKNQTIKQYNSQVQSTSTLEALQLLKIKTQQYGQESALSSQNIEKDLSNIKQLQKHTVSESAGEIKLKRLISMPETIMKYEEFTNTNQEFNTENLHKDEGYSHENEGYAHKDEGQQVIMQQNNQNTKQNNIMNQQKQKTESQDNKQEKNQQSKTNQLQNNNNSQQIIPEDLQLKLQSNNNREREQQQIKGQQQTQQHKQQQQNGVLQNTDNIKQQTTNEVLKINHGNIDSVQLKQDQVQIEQENMLSQSNKDQINNQNNVMQQKQKQRVKNQEIKEEQSYNTIGIISNIQKQTNSYAPKQQQVILKQTHPQTTTTNQQYKSIQSSITKSNKPKQDYFQFQLDF